MIRVRLRHFGVTLCAGIVLASTGEAHAAQVHRCVTNGKVTYSDVPCPNANPAPGQATTSGGTLPQSTATTTAPKPDSFYGSWTGQAQYQATAKGQPLEAAHAVVSLILTIAPDGKVTGESKGNGCRALGVAAPSNPQMMNLDVSLSRCNYAGFNRRYTGTLGLPPGQGYTRLGLVSYDTRAGASVMYDVKATMRR
jgi:hypothetical protein